MPSDNRVAHHGESKIIARTMTRPAIIKNLFSGVSTWLFSLRVRDFPESELVLDGSETDSEVERLSDLEDFRLLDRDLDEDEPDEDEREEDEREEDDDRRFDERDDLPERLDLDERPDFDERPDSDEPSDDDLRFPDRRLRLRPSSFSEELFSMSGAATNAYKKRW